MKNNRFDLYDIVLVGVMAAICFATTVFLKITIPTPAGPVMLKLGNVFCLLAGLLFGGLRGGLAAGIGSALYDLTDPLFVADTPLTFIRFFLMAFLCGVIAQWGNRNKKGFAVNILAATVGSAFSLAFYWVKNITELVLAGSVFSAAVTAATVKLVVSGINAVAAVIIAVAIAPACKKALLRAGLGQKIPALKKTS
ncbi:ECF transporter S component [Oscillospiraceae bacterium MB08-C2-2]|nr:ECF transporter S component [Oscillospiraceae bacterium MB08-C2-2]